MEYLAFFPIFGLANKLELIQDKPRFEIPINESTCSGHASRLSGSNLIYKTRELGTRVLYIWRDVHELNADETRPLSKGI
jgi:hypothetical protein